MFSLPHVCTHSACRGPRPRLIHSLHEPLVRLGRRLPPHAHHLCGGRCRAGGAPRAPGGPGGRRERGREGAWGDGFLCFVLSLGNEKMLRISVVWYAGTPEGESSDRKFNACDVLLRTLLCVCLKNTISSLRLFPTPPLGPPVPPQAVRRALEAYSAYVSYAANGGDGAVRGDGVCPIDCGQVPGAEVLLLPGVRHLPAGRGGETGRGDGDRGTEGDARATEPAEAAALWYGSPAVVQRWARLIWNAGEGAREGRGGVVGVEGAGEEEERTAAREVGGKVEKRG